MAWWIRFIGLCLSFCSSIASVKTTKIHASIIQSIAYIPFITASMTSHLKAKRSLQLQVFPHKLSMNDGFRRREVSAKKNVGQSSQNYQFIVYSHASLFDSFSTTKGSLSHFFCQSMTRCEALDFRKFIKFVAFANWVAQVESLTKFDKAKFVI